MNSYTSENMLLIHKQKCEILEIPTFRFSNKSHLQGKNHFHKYLWNFRIYADLEADNEIDNSSTGNKTTDVCKQIPVINYYYIVSGLESVLKSGWYESSMGYEKQIGLLMRL